MQVSKDHSCACPNKKHPRSSAGKKYPFFIGLLIAIIPKCPFCVLAYSSAMTLCNGSQLYLHQSGWTSWISIALVAFTLVMVLINYRGRRTWWAAATILTGGAMVAIAELYTGHLQWYYGGVALIFLGIWINASLLSLLRSLARAWKRRDSVGLRQQLSAVAQKIRIF